MLRSRKSRRERGMAETIERAASIVADAPIILCALAARTTRGVTWLFTEMRPTCKDEKHMKKQDDNF